MTIQICPLIDKIRFSRLSAEIKSSKAQLLPTMEQERLTLCRTSSLSLDHVQNSSSWRMTRVSVLLVTSTRPTSSRLLRKISHCWSSSLREKISRFHL